MDIVGYKKLKKVIHKKGLVCIFVYISKTNYKNFALLQ